MKMLVRSQRCDELAKPDRITRRSGFCWLLNKGRLFWSRPTGQLLATRFASVILSFLIKADGARSCQVRETLPSHQDVLTTATPHAVEEDMDNCLKASERTNRAAPFVILTHSAAAVMEGKEFPALFIVTNNRILSDSFT